MFVTVDGTPQEIADLLFAVRNRQLEICSPKDTFEESLKSVLDVPTKKRARRRSNEQERPE